MRCKPPFVSEAGGEFRSDFFRGAKDWQPTSHNARHAAIKEFAASAMVFYNKISPELHALTDSSLLTSCRIIIRDLVSPPTSSDQNMDNLALYPIQEVYRDIAVAEEVPRIDVWDSRLREHSWDRAGGVVHAQARRQAPQLFPPKDQSVLLSAPHLGDVHKIHAG